MMRIKICGITNHDDALFACEAGADALGFVFAPEARKRNRYISPEAAAKIIAELPPYVVTVGVVVNLPLSDLAALSTVVDRLQLHGEESPEYCVAAGPLAYKALRIDKYTSLQTLAAYPGDALLVDAAAPGERGGTGLLADWQAAVAAKESGKHIILAGGLNPDNVAEAVNIVRPWAVDVSSGVEASPGKKDHERIRAFIQHARKASLA